MKKYKNYAAFRKDLYNECKAYLTAYGIAYCQKAADELTKAAQIAIEQFYNGYEPAPMNKGGYDRTYNLKNNSYKRYYKNNGRVAEGGVYIGSDYMDTYYKKTREGFVERDPDLVSSTAWETGLHGIYGLHVESGVNEIPIVMFNKKFNDKEFQDSLEEAGELAAEASIKTDGILAALK